MKATVRAALIIFSFLATLSAASATDELPLVRVGVIVDGPWDGNEWIFNLTVGEVRTLTAGEFDVRFPEESYLVGDWTLETAQRNLEQLLTDPGVDIVLTWGLLVSHTVCCYGELPKPVVAPVVADVEIQGLPLFEGRSRTKNLSYVALPDTLAEDLSTFRSIVPFDRVAILANGAFLAALPELVDRTRHLLAGTEFEFDYVAVGGTAESGLTAIPAEADAVFVWPQFQLSQEEYRRLVDGLIERRLPTFSGIGGQDLEAGMLASALADEFFPRLTRRVALNVQRILLGEEPGEIAVEFNIPRRLIINMKTARRIGVSPTWDSLIEAELLHPVADGLPVRTLRSSMEEVVRLNLDIVARQRGLAASAQNIAQARSRRLPQLTGSITGTQIDDDRAAASFGTQAERTWTGSLSLEQLIYSDAAVGNVEVQRRLQEAAEWDLESLRLDLALDAAVAYLNLLRAETLVKVQRNNLQLTRSNLELAETRRTIGAASSAEVYRWESQIATDRQSLIDALAQQEVSAIALNRLLHRDIEEPFTASPVDFNDPEMIVSQDRFEGFTETPARFRVFRDFMVGEGLANSPQLKLLEANIGAQERLLATARRSFWSPDFSLQAALDEIVSREGAGSEPQLGLGTLTADDTNWSFTLFGSLPLYAGGARRADRVQREEQLWQLRFEYQSAVEKIEEQIRSQMLFTRAAFASVDLSRQAADAAARNLELVADAYARGAVSILDLLDAQNSALNADLQAANSVYDFFVELMRAQRATSRFETLRTSADRDAWFERLQTFFRLRGVPDWQPAPPRAESGSR